MLPRKCARVKFSGTVALAEVTYYRRPQTRKTLVDGWKRSIRRFRAER